ncbi:extracellular solute-binding protein [Paenibacillus sp. LHD-38]|uniref:extracellular solute-binding protein n=1 Tax=Paenibacillus sp. LHD-38 TaxID=3072143 RepID=UPI00280FD246|nr:extracellular solute-binding protein [Paenibacillus sp. LHD-38]MDQ8738134.1 extracellular solute-binding protein [Paenibacillus sp. LHD-38]
MYKKRLVSLALAAVMTVGMLAGCTNGNNNEPTNLEPSGNSASPSASANESTNAKYPDYSKGFTEKVSLEIPVYERAFEGWNVIDNYYTRYIQKEFGDKNNIDVKFVPITRSAEVRDYEQLLASGKAPDIIFHYDMPQAVSYYGEGVMQPLDWDEMANYAPTYWENMSETIKQYGTIDDKNVFFFASRPNVNNFVSIIRKDWVEKVGMKVEDLTSLEKYNEMLVKWKETGLGVAGVGLIKDVFNYSYAFRDWPVDPKYRALYSDIGVADFTTADTERFLKNMNYQVNNGLIDKEFYLRDDGNKNKAEFVAGHTGTYGEYFASNSDVIAATLKNNPEAQFAVLPPTALVPEGRVPQGRADWPFGFIMGINHKATAEERAAVWMYLEWMSQPDNLFLLQNGVEGQNYTLDSDGLAVKNPDFKGESVLAQNNNKDYWGLVTEAPQYATPELARKAYIRNWAPAGYEYLIEDSLNYADKYREYSMPDTLFTIVLNKVNENKADLNNLFQELYLKIVIGTEDKFDEAYAAAKKQYLEAGYQEILDEKQAAIDAGNFK